MRSLIWQFLLLSALLHIHIITCENTESKAYSPEDDEVIDDTDAIGVEPADPMDAAKPDMGKIPPIPEDIQAIRERMRKERETYRNPDIDVEDARKRAEEMMANMRRDGINRERGSDEEREKRRTERMEQRRAEREQRREQRRKLRDMPPHERGGGDPRFGDFDPRKFDRENFDPNNFDPRARRDRPDRNRPGRGRERPNRPDRPGRGRDFDPKKFNPRGRRDRPRPNRDEL